ncbi:head maturation protease, ClpP-related [Methylophaga sp.]|uniref:head maturation protease, ClpP-related n=1 Tax=Methylophaga sp. TaxID=2024840 RepID=UPI003A9037DE
MKFNRSRAQARAVAAYWNKDLNDRDWYSVKAADDDGKAEIRIYDVIGWPFVEAEQLLSELDNLQASNIKVRINSPGGSVFEGMAIYNAFADHKANITTQVDSLAASMASIIALAGNERLIYRNAQYMIHNPWTIMIGDHRDLYKEAEFLETIRDQLAEIYVNVSGKKLADIQQMMDEETWLTGAKAVEAGFMTKATTAGAGNARFDLSMYDHPPQSNEPTKKDLERALTRDAGLTRTQALSVLQKGFDGLSTRDAGENETLNAVLNLSKKFKD